MILSRQGVNGHYECPRSLTLTTLGQRAEVELLRLQTSVRTQDRAGRRQHAEEHPAGLRRVPGILRQALNNGHIGGNYMNQG